MGYFDKQTGMNVMKGKEQTDTIALNKICPRYVNKWIRNKEDAEGTKKSIKENGLFAPISVNKIEDYLAKVEKELPNEAKEYYKNELKDGREFFISSGHTRFYAYCSLCADKDIHTKEDLIKFYKEYNDIVLKDTKALQEGKSEGRNRFLSIPAIVVKDDYKKERNRYNSANIDQRAKQDFEVIVNIIDEMKDEGVWGKVEEEIKSSLLDNMQDRAVIRNLESIYEKQGKKATFKTIEEAKNLLNEIPVNLIPGYNKSINEKIKEYISKTRGKEISIASINFTRTIIEKYDKDLINYIFNGLLKYHHARELLSVYGEISKTELDKIKKQIEKGTFDIKVIKKQYAKEKQEKSVPFSQKDWKELFIKLYDKELTIDDAYKKLKDLKVL